MTWATPNLNRLLPKIGRIIWNCTFQQYHVILDSHFSANSSQITFAKTRAGFGKCNLTTVSREVTIENNMVLLKGAIPNNTSNFRQKAV